MTQLFAFSNSSTVCLRIADNIMLSSLSADKNIWAQKGSLALQNGRSQIITKSQISHSLEQAKSLGTFPKSHTSEKAQGLTKPA